MFGTDIQKPKPLTATFQSSYSCVNQTIMEF